MWQALAQSGRPVVLNYRLEWLPSGLFPAPSSVLLKRHAAAANRQVSANDHNVTQSRLVDRLVEPETFGDPFVGRVAQHDIAAADQHRDIVHGDMNMIEHFLGAGVAIEIGVRVRMPVTGQEFFDAKRDRGMVRPKKDDISEVLVNQLHPAKDKGAHENLAQLTVGLHQSQQVFAIYLDDLAFLPQTECGVRRDANFPVNWRRNRATGFSVDRGWTTST